MRLHRIKAILLQEFFITRKSIEVIMDIFFFSLISVIVFGFVNISLTGTLNPLAAKYLFIGILLWEIVRISQYSMSVGSLWNIWSRNLSNMFITPLTLKEFMFAHMLSGMAKAFLVFTVISILSLTFFNFNIFAIGFWNLLFIFLNLTLFAWSIGICILAFIFRYGTRIQALAWGLVFIFQPLTAAFFPLKVLPSFLQSVATIFPPTYAFETARNALVNPSFNSSLITIALIENVIYFLGSLVFFRYMFNKSKDTGQFARNEG